MVNISYHAARMQGMCNRSLYHTMLPLLVKRSTDQSQRVPLVIYSMSCERDLLEQAASLYSFLRHVGLPDRFTVISDGSYSKKSIRLLHQISPCVDVVDVADIVSKDLPKIVEVYATSSPMGKKLAVELSLPVKQTTVYVDSDVLFFPGAKELAVLSESKDALSWYLPDLPGALDGRLCSEVEKQNPVNGGFMILKKPLNWELALDRLARLQDSPRYFTEQTIVHLAMHQNGAKPLSANRFVVATDDQFRYSDIYAGNHIALRHYVGPVRHKFWSHFRHIL